MTMLSEPDFGGRIGRTYRDSEPWWPNPPAGLGGPNVVMVVLDDVGFGHFGCYGSELRTPSIDRLAAGGVRYTSFHTTALCSPSRACLLTGRNHHSVGMRAVTAFDSGFPHMRGGMNPRAATVAELLGAHGYATYCVGKWHLTPNTETSPAGPHTHWPLQKGFDRFYGFMQGEVDQFSPELMCDNAPIDPPGRPEDGYHVSEDLVDRSIGMINDLKSVRPDRPFFLYLAMGATHAPHQAPEEYLQRCRGRFDEGYDVMRERWFARQLELGIVPAGTTLAPRNPGVPAWEELTANQRAFSARLQEAFAAQLEHADAQIGRLVEFLEQRDLLDDTIVMIVSDNGASPEGGPYGVMDEYSFFNMAFEDIDEIVANRLDDIGGPHSHPNYPWGWAQAGNTPLRWYKQNTYGGGVRDPLVVHWPNGIEARGEIRPQFCHAVDLAPTILELTGAPVPEEFGGVAQMPMHGASIAATFADGSVPAARSRQYFEQFGHRGLWDDGWKITTHHQPGQPYDDDEWCLYHVDEDFSECHDLAAEYPEKLRELIDAWWAEAGHYGVLPLDDRMIELFAPPPRPGTPHARGGEYVYYPPMAHIPMDVAPWFGGRSWTITAAVTVPPGGVQGVLYARGGHNIGHSFFVADGALQFDCNALGTHYRARGPLAIEPGRHDLTARFDAEGAGGTLTVGVDGHDLAAVDIPKVMHILGSAGLDIGRDALSPVVDDYDAPFPFTGSIERVTFHLRDEPDAPAAVARAELSKE